VIRAKHARSCLAAFLPVLLPFLFLGCCGRLAKSAGSGTVTITCLKRDGGRACVYRLDAVGRMVNSTKPLPSGTDQASPFGMVVSVNGIIATGWNAYDGTGIEAWIIDAEGGVHRMKRCMTQAKGVDICLTGRRIHVLTDSNLVYSNSIATGSDDRRHWTLSTEWPPEQSPARAWQLRDRTIASEVVYSTMISAATKNVYSFPFPIYCPQWSMDGRSIIGLRRNSENGFSVVVFDTVGKRVRDVKLVGMLGSIRRAAWMGLPNYVLVETTESAKFRTSKLWRVRLSGGKAREVTRRLIPGCWAVIRRHEECASPAAGRVMP